MKNKISYMMLAIAPVLLAGCASVQSADSAKRAVNLERGQASFYADRYQSRKTASGERYDHGKRTAAHKTLPFGTRVKVTNTKNNKTVVVKINDRGPFVRGRIIDLSKSAFSRIGNTSAGILPVTLEVIE
ncbi:septal ring lytic transglycosylase RlpA family protein [Leucothrix mucor]|uniref:septal ring lytic transglycosylase RlpA family protein n=1 Tax=Leucothrix mucor TaxID=45248 RepID=UPI0003B5EE90|nr:septal ring lytic transglycosylase RlpA family protein [Leucothrix mucor]